MHRGQSNQQIKPVKRMFDQSGTLFLNGVQLQPSLALGFSQQQDSLHCLEDNKIAFLCGSGITVYNTVTGLQSIISIPESNILRVYKNNYNQQCFLFVHNNPDSIPTVSIFNYWKKKREEFILQNLEKGSQVIDICFLSDVNQIIVLSKEATGGCKLSCIQILKQKKTPCMETIDYEIKGMFQGKISLYNFYYFSQNTITNCYFRTQAFIHQTLKIQLEQSQRINCCCLLNNVENVILYATSLGNMYICFQSAGEIRKIEKQSLGGKRIPSAICCNDIFILVGYEHVSEFTCFKLSNLSFLKRERVEIKLPIENIERMGNLNVGEDQSTVCILLQMKNFTYEDQMLSSTSKSIHQKGRNIPMVFNYLLHETAAVHTKTPFFTLFDKIVTNKQIIDMEVCLLKKMVLVLSADRTMRAYSLQRPDKKPLTSTFIWQYQFPQYAYSFSMHPINQNVSVAFKDQMKLFNLCLEGLRYLNISHPQKSQIVRYSPQGSYLATIHQNTSLILFNSYSYEICHILNLNNSYIKTFQFTSQQQILVSSKSNSVILINFIGKTKVDHHNRVMKLTACVYDPVSEILVVGYNESLAKIFIEGGKNELGIVYTYPFYFTELMVSSEFSVLFAGTSVGSIRVYEWPVTDIQTFQKGFVEYKLHTKSITGIKISNDLKYLITSSEDGSVIISKIKHYSNGFQTSEAQINSIFCIQSKDNLLDQLKQLILDSFQDDRQKDQAVLRLEADKLVHTQWTHGQILNQKRNYDGQYQKTQNQKRLQKRQASQLFTKDIKYYQQQKNKLMQRKIELDLKFKGIENIKEQFVQKIKIVYERTKCLKANKTQLIQQYESQINEIISKHKKFQKSTDENLSSFVSEKTKKHEVDINVISSEQCEQQEMTQQHFQGTTVQKSNYLLQKTSNRLLKTQKTSDELKRQNRFLESSIQIFKERKLKSDVLQETIDEKMDVLGIEKQKRKRGIQIAAHEIVARDQIINYKEEKAKKLLQFNIYQINQEGCLRHTLAKCEDEYEQLKIEDQELQEKKDSLYKKLVKQTTNNQELIRLTTEAESTISNSKQIINKLSQKLHSKKYCIQKIAREVEIILHSGLDLKSQLFGMMNHINIENSYDPTEEHNFICAEKQNKRDAYRGMMHETMRFHEATKQLKNNYEQKIRSHATLLICQYNRLKFEQVDLKETLKYLQREQVEMKRQKQKIIIAKMRSLNRNTSELFPTAVPQQVKPKTMSNTRRNFRKTKICKGTSKMKGLFEYIEPKS